MRTYLGKNSLLIQTRIYIPLPHLANKMAGTHPSYIVSPWDRPMLHDEKMADREKVVRLHKYHDFWDTLVKDLDNVERRARGEDVEDEDEPDLFTVEKNVNLRGQWNENLETASWSKRLRNDHEIVKAEIRMCSKAALAMRRVALKQLFEKEFEMYEKELSMVGKTFYKQRI